MEVRVVQASALQDPHSAAPEREILRLRPQERKPLEERDDAGAELGKRIDLPDQPPFPARHIVPQPRTSRKASSGARSCRETLKAAEIRQPPCSLPRLRHMSMKLASPSANPARNDPSEAGMASMNDLSC